MKDLFTNYKKSYYWYSVFNRTAIPITDKLYSILIMISSPQFHLNPKGWRFVTSKKHVVEQGVVANKYPFTKHPQLYQTGKAQQGVDINDLSLLRMPAGQLIGELVS